MTPLRAELQLNCEKFLNGIKSVDGAIEGLHHKIAGFTALFGGLALAAHEISEQFAKAAETMELGATLQNLSADTGQSVSDLLVLRQAFQNAGAGADAVQPSLAILSKALAGVSETGEATKPVFDKLGVSILALRDMSATQQIMTIGEAIRGLKNPANQAKAAMDLFGRKGAKLLQLLKNPEAWTAARDQVGGLADTMQEKSEAFHTISDAIGSLHLKFEQFYAGLAGANSDDAEDFFKKLANMDFTNAGESAGQLAQQVFTLVGYVKMLTPALAGVAAAMAANSLATKAAGTALELNMTQALMVARAELSGFAMQCRLASLNMTSLATVGRTAFASLAAGARSLVAALGPVTIAITAATAGFSYIMGKADKIKNATRAIKDIGAEKENQFKGNVAEMQNVTNDDQRAEMAKKLAAQLEEVHKKLQSVNDDYDEGFSDAGRADITQQYQNWADILEAQQRSLQKIPGDVLAARAATQREAAALEEAKKQADELRKSLSKALEEYDKFKDKQSFDSLGLDEQRNKILNQFGPGNDEASIERGIGIQRNLPANQQNPEQLEKLMEASKQLAEINKKREEAAKKAAEAEAGHGEKVAELQAELAGNQAKLEQLKREEALRRRIKELKDAGVSNPEAKAREETGLEQSVEGKKKQKTLDDFNKDFGRDMARIAAQMSGDKDKVREIDRGKRADELTKEGVSAGLGEPEARRRAELRATAEQQLADQGQPGSRGPAASALQRIGGGGGVGGGDPAQQERKRQSRLLEQIRDAVKTKSSTNTSPGVAVFG